MRSPEQRRQVSVMLDYLFGKGVSRALPRSGIRLAYSRRSGRPKMVFHEDNLFATIRPNGAMAISLYGATVLSASPRFKENCVRVDADAVPFVVAGMSVFCKFVRWAGSNIYPKGEVAVLDPEGRVVGVGTAVLNGKHMAEFKSGVAVKVRDGLGK